MVQRPITFPPRRTCPPSPNDASFAAEDLPLARSAAGDIAKGVIAARYKASIQLPPRRRIASAIADIDVRRSHLDANAGRTWP